MDPVEKTGERKEYLKKGDSVGLIGARDSDRSKPLGSKPLF